MKLCKVRDHSHEAYMADGKVCPESGLYTDEVYSPFHEGSGSTLTLFDKIVQLALPLLKIIQRELLS